MQADEIMQAIGDELINAETAIRVLCQECDSLKAELAEFKAARDGALDYLNRQKQAKCFVVASEEIIRRLTTPRSAW